MTALEKRILIIDDDPDVAKLLTAILKPQGFDVHRASDGQEGLKMAYELHPDLIILDVMMPVLDGWEVCRRLREMSNVPILMLTARTLEADILRGFAAGADDFVEKPFRPAELEARLRALLRRKNGPKNIDASSVSRYKDDLLEIDLETRKVELNGKAISLSLIEYNLLACLVRNLGNVVSHRHILQQVWGNLFGDLSSTVTLQIFYLRKKLEDGKHGHRYIQTQWGRGYLFLPKGEVDGVGGN